MDNIYPQSQRDIKWRSKLLGFNTASAYSIGSYGCLISCISMVINHFDGKVVENPLTINDKLKSVNGFIGGGLYVWGSISKVFPNIKEVVVNTPLRLNDAQMKLLHDSLDVGNPVMLQVDFNPETAPTDMHYVLAVDWDKGDEDNIFIVDPWTGEFTSLKTYTGKFRTSARQAIEQMVFYTTSGEKPATDDSSALQDKIKALEAEVDSLRKSRNEWRDKNKQLETMLQEMRGDLEQRDGEINQLKDARGKLAAQVSALQTALATNKTPLSEYNIGDFLKEIWERIKP